MKNINPPGIWKETIDDLRWKFYNPEISAVYGFVAYQVRAIDGFDWYWEARCSLDTRESFSSLPICGYAPTPEAAKTIIETILRETLTVDFSS